MGKIAAYNSENYLETGFETLKNIAVADRFNQWMYDEISCYCKGRILEIGSGTGNISAFFLANGNDITLSEPEPDYCKILSERFDDGIIPVSLIQMDITDPAFDQKFKHLFGSFDTVFSLNVIEHILDDNLAVCNCKKLLRSGGKLIILVPAFQSLYNLFDKSLGHYRRYSKKTLNRLMENSSLEVISIRYFNSAGILGWFLSGNILRKKVVPEDQMKLYNALVPFFRIIDVFTRRILGLSLIVVSRKNQN